ncbi:hypothetical protein FJY71_01495, partial [candidate division WOR-3 bacterium]|nr:hypothetical protein [candidate division WOR-3 bacterium]
MLRSLSVLLVAAGVPGAVLQAAVWGPDVRLTSNSYYDYTDLSSQRNVVVDPAERVHVVWYQYGPWTNGYQLMYKRYTPGSGWSRDTCITLENAALYHSRYPSLTCDSAGNLGLVYNCGTSSNASQFVYFKACAPSGTGNDGWDPAGRLLSNDVQSQYKYVPSVAATPDGHLHVVWIQDRSPDYSVVYRERIDTAWTAEHAVYSSAHYRYGTTVAGDRGNNVHVIWYGASPTSGYYQVNYLARIGGTWMTTPQNVSNGGSQHNYYPSLAIDPGTNRPAVAWWGYPVNCAYPRIVYKARLGAAPADTWQRIGDTLSEPGINYYQYSPHLAITPGGYSHCVWYGNSVGQPTWYQLRYAERWPGRQWLQPIDLTRTTGSHRYVPALAPGAGAGPDDIHLVWYDYRHGGTGEIYYRRAAPPPPDDVGVLRIVAPAGACTLQTIAPAGWIRNYGTRDQGPFPVRLDIPPGYTSTVQTAPLPVGDSQLVSFNDWTPPGPGIYTARCTTALPGDQNNANDTASSVILIADLLERFEPGNSTYQPDPGSGGWTWRSPATPRPGAPSQPNVWTAPDSGLHANNADWKLVSCQYFAMRDTPVVCFLHWYSFETGRDGGNVQYSTDNGATWLKLRPWTQYSLPYYGVVTALADTGWTGSTMTWLPTWFKVPVSAGTPVKLRWRMRSDASGQNLGWMVDNVAALGLRHARDAASLRILAPVDTADYGQPITPRARVANQSAVPLSFSIRFDVTGLYAETTTATLPPADSASVSFPDFTPDTCGPFLARCSTRLAAEDYPQNDRAEALFFIRKVDVAPVQILSPYDTAPGALFRPAVRLRNHGTQAATLSLRLFIDRGTDQTVYDTIETGILLDAGATLDHQLATPWLAESSGSYIATAMTILPGDMVPHNDLIRKPFTISPLFARGWREAAPMPAAPSGKACKDGAWLCLGPDSLVYAAKGNKAADFYAYEPLADSWTGLPPIPAGLEARPPYRGAVGVFDGLGAVYATKGNNTQGFWRYSVDSMAWQQLADVPLGNSRKRVKGGTDMVYVVRDDTGWAYLLKGLGQDFFRYNTVRGVWDTLLPLAPAGSYPKWDKGSWLVFDGNASLYAHKAKRHELWRFDLAAKTWSTSSRPGMPLVGMMGRSKKSKDGGSAAVDSAPDGTGIYALKGGNTQEFWQYSCLANAWTELDTMPCF